jgi:two-component system sensor histidine kinase TctE
MRGKRQHASWLTRDLLLRLMLPLLAIVIATGALGTYTAHRLTDRVFDRWLLDAARSVGALVRFDAGRASLDLPPAAETVLLFDDSDQTYFSVMQDGRLLAGRPDLPQSGRDESQFRRGTTFEAMLDGQPVRVARIELKDAQGRPATVQVAETLVKRRGAARELLVILWPMAALLLAAAAAIVLAVRYTVRPLEAIAARWNERSQASLQPIADADVPRELLPVARALNNLVARIKSMLARERQFAATAAHQLRNPLAGLQLGLARAADAPDLAQTRQVISELSQSTQLTSRLVGQLLTLGRIDPEARGELDMQRCDLVALVRDVGAMHADHAIAKQIDLELICASERVIVQVQSELMAEALANLIDNAVRYTPAGGRVRIEIFDRPASIQISDSGPGIAPEEREEVLERFVRGRAATGEGSGLGLAIARDITTLHGAALTLGESVWSGLVVTVSFDREQESAPSA